MISLPMMFMFHLISYRNFTDFIVYQNVRYLLLFLSLNKDLTAVYTLILSEEHEHGF